MGAVLQGLLTLLLLAALLALTWVAVRGLQALRRRTREHEPDPEDPPG